MIESETTMSLPCWWELVTAGAQLICMDKEAPWIGAKVSHCIMLMGTIWTRILDPWISMAWLMQNVILEAPQQCPRRPSVMSLWFRALCHSECIWCVVKEETSIIWDTPIAWIWDLAAWPANVTTTVFLMLCFYCALSLKLFHLKPMVLWSRGSMVQWSNGPVFHLKGVMSLWSDVLCSLCFRESSGSCLTFF